MNSQELLDLINNYQPRLETLNALKEIKLVALVGPTAVGKTTLIEHLVQKDSSICRVVSDVSRPPREGEVNGVDYNFRSQDDMVEDLHQGRYIQVVLSADGDPYGSMPSNYGSGGVAIMAIRASVVRIFRNLPFKEVQIICVVPPSYDIWQQRMAVHRFSQGDYVSRMREARQSLEFANTDKHAQLVVNDDLMFATDMCMAIIKGEALSVEQLANQQAAKPVINSILERID